MAQARRQALALLGQLAAARSQVARDTQVPRQVVLAHPHLRLMLEHCERAAAAAVADESERFGELVRSAREDEQLSCGVLRQPGWTVPSAK